MFLYLPFSCIHPQFEPFFIVVVAHHPYEATQDDEISFKKDDHINVTDNSDPDWWVGTLETTGATGLFPSNVNTIETPENIFTIN